MSTRFLRVIALLGALLAPALTQAQAPAAGRVLLAIGEVSVQRGGQSLPLAFNAPVFPGDTLRLGANSNAQIRMTDESILGLRERTVFRIDEYQYSQGTGRSLFSLLAGGIRTVTGAIGRLKQDQAYAVRTPTSTIGIRGTHYTVVYCNNDCGATGSASLQVASAGSLEGIGPLAQAGPGPGGNTIPNGTYGGVSDGRINVAPLSAQQLGREFGNDEYFFNANASSAPQSLIAPPSFLYDRLSGQQRSQGQQSSGSSSGEGQSLSSGGINSESRPSSVPAAPAPSTFIVTEQKTSTGQTTVAPATLDTAVFLSVDTIGFHSDPPGGAALVSKSALTLNSSGVPTAFKVSAGCVGPNDDCNHGVEATLGSPLQTGSATFPDSTQVVFWGRWASGTITDETTYSLSANNQAHMMYAPLTPESVIAAKTGTLQLTTSFAGYGTTPTNNLGATATSGSFPTLNINFTSRTVSASSSSVNFPSAGTGTQNWFFNSGSGSLVVANGGAYFQLNGTGSCSSSGTACNGSSSATASGRINAIFIGPAGDHLGAAISGVAGNSNFGTVRVYCASGC